MGQSNNININDDSCDKKSLKKELENKVKQYSKLIDMIDSPPPSEETDSMASKPTSWAERFKRIFKKSD